MRRYKVIQAQNVRFGKVEYTIAELENLLNQAYNEGYEDAKRESITLSYGNYSIPKTSFEITCNDNDTIPCNKSITGQVSLWDKYDIGDSKEHSEK